MQENIIIGFIILALIIVCIKFVCDLEKDNNNKANIRGLEKKIDKLMMERQNRRCYETYEHCEDDWQITNHTGIPIARCKHCYKSPLEIETYKKNKDEHSNKISNNMEYFKKEIDKLKNDIMSKEKTNG